MNTHEDQVWDEVVEAATPNAAEMAEAEAGLRELGDVGPMGGADVERLVARATASESKRPLGLVGATAGARRWKQPLVKAAAAVLLLMAVAGLAWEKVWSSEHESRDPNAPLGFKEAVRLATEPGREDNAYMSALGQIYEPCAFAADTLQKLAAQGKEPTLANQARQIASDLAALLANGPKKPSGVVDLRLVESALTALDDNHKLDLRQQALAHVGALTKGGLTAILLAPLKGDEAKSFRNALIQNLLNKLPR